MRSVDSKKEPQFTKKQNQSLSDPVSSVSIKLSYFMKALFLANIAVTFLLTGLIWLVQLVNYPSFAYWGERINEAHQFHSTRISIIVVPLMLIELGTSLVLVAMATQFRWAHIAGLVCVLLVWVVTFVWIVPIHNNLPTSDNLTEVVQQLVNLNLVRTILWTTKATIGFYMLYSVINDRGM